MSVIRVLVVDDFEPWRQRIRSILETAPEFHIIAEASNGVKAIQIAQELNPDLILLDIGLPELNGIEAGNRLRQLVPLAKVLFISQNNDADVVREAFSNGGLGYVLKTDAGSELLPAIRAVLRGKTFISSGIEAHGSSQKKLNSSITHDAKPFLTRAKRMRHRVL